MYRLYAFLSLLLCYLTGHAQEFPDFKFRYLTMKDGLTNDHVTGIAQDKNGFIWLGTANGLNRYDGKRIKQFFHDPEKANSLPNNKIWAVCVDHKNRIWINTPDGLSCYDQYSDKFTNYSHNPADENSLPESLVNNIYIDTANNIWLSTKKGFYTVNDQLVLQKKHIPLLKTSKGQETVQLIRPIYRDNIGKLWTWDESNLFQLDPVSMQPVKAYPYSFKYLSAIFQDNQNRYWVSTGLGKLFIFDDQAGRFKEFKMQSPEISILHISEWNDGKDCWLVLPGFSLTLINTKTLQTKVYPPNIYNKTGYQGTFWAQLFTDRDNRLWMGYERGCNILQLALQKTDIIPITAPNQIPYQEPAYKLIESFHADTAFFWVYKGPGGGIFQYDHQFKLVNRYTSLIPLSKQIRNETSYVNDIKVYKDHFYATGSFGLLELNLKTFTSRFVELPGKKKNIPLLEMIAAGPGIWWLRSVSNGIYVFDTEKREFISQYQPTKNCKGNCLPDYITGIYALKGDKIFVTGSFSLWEYDKNQNTFISHTNFLPVPYINAMDLDAEGVLWLGTTKGIYLYDPVKKKIVRQFSENNKIGSVFSILIDKYNNAWCNTRSQIWCWARKKHQWVDYSSLDGLPAEVYECVLSNLPDGSVVAGIGEKLVRFAPGFLEQNLTASVPVYITDVAVGKKEISLTGKAYQEKKISLASGQNNFSVDFAVLNYEQPASVKYMFRLEPAMKDFEENPTGHLTFNSLAPGNYRLVVKGADKLNNLTEKEDILEIFIRPRWYQTLAFKLTAILASVFIIIFFVSRRIKVVRREEALKQKITETEIAALKAQLNPHFIFNCISCIDGLIQNNERYNATTYLNKFAKLIRSVLEFSKENTIDFSRDLETLKLYLDLEQLRNEDKYTTQLFVAEELKDNNYIVPPLIIQPFVENAIQHGLKNKPGKEGILHIEIKRTGDHLQYVIFDNGVGRKATEKKGLRDHKSLGVQISIDRIRLFNNEKIPSVLIEDKILNGMPAGTVVTVKLKLK